MGYVQNKKILVRNDGDESILFNPENGELHKINNHAFFIWNCLKLVFSFDQILKKIEEKYAFKSREELEEKVRKVLDYFKDKDLIVEK